MCESLSRVFGPCSQSFGRLLCFFFGSCFASACNLCAAASATVWRWTILLLSVAQNTRPAPHARARKRRRTLAECARVCAYDCADSMGILPLAARPCSLHRHTHNWHFQFRSAAKRFFKWLGMSVCVSLAGSLANMDGSPSTDRTHAAVSFGPARFARCCVCSVAANVGTARTGRSRSCVCACALCSHAVSALVVCLEFTIFLCTYGKRSCFQSIYTACNAH